MNKLIQIVAVLAVLSLGTSAMAQTAGPKGQNKGQNQAQRQNRQKMAEAMKKIQTQALSQVKATAKQKNEIDALGKKRDAAMLKLREELKASGANRDEAARAELREKVQKIQKDYQAGLQKILGAEKYAEFQKVVKAEMQKLREKAGQGQRGGAGKGKGKG